MPTQQASPALVRFGIFEADLRAGELRRSGVRVRLQDLPFRALALLLTRPGEVITREEFRQALWPPDVFVDFEQGISSAVMRLRDALRDSAENPIFIETIERRGYRWIGPIQVADAVADEPARQEQTKEKEKESTEKQSVSTAAALSPAPSRWGKMAFAIPVLAILFCLWIFRTSSRDARASADSGSSTASLHTPANHEAEELYLKGRFYWNKRTPESLNQALDAFNQAIAHDPKYSDAYVGLADCYDLLPEFSTMPANEAYFKAFAAARKAADLAPQSSEAHASLGFVTFWGMWEAADAEKEFRRAIQLDPNNVNAHHWYATFLHSLGRREESLSEIELARKLAPDSPSILADKGELLRAAGQRQPALQLLKQLEAADPNFVSPHRYLRFLYLQARDFNGYLAELKEEAQLTHDPTQIAVADAAAKGFSRHGGQGLLQAQLLQQRNAYERRKLSPYFVAQTEARLGHKVEALRYLTIGVQSHDAAMLDMGIDDNFAGLHGDSAFERLLATVGLPQVN